MALFDSISAQLGGLVGARKTFGARRGAYKTLSDVATSLKLNGSIACSAGVWKTIGSYTVTPQTRMRVGYGRSGDTGQPQGILYTVLKTQAVAKHGELRVLIQDAEGRVKPDGYIIHSVRTERLDDSSGDRAIAFLVPEMGPYANEDDEIVVQFKSDATVTLDGNENANGSTLLLDVTLYS